MYQLININETNPSAVIFTNYYIPTTIARMAARLALRANHFKFRHGSVIWRKKHIVSSAFNTCYKTTPYGSGFHRSCHAEVMAILKARKVVPNLSGYNIFTIRINHLGQVRTSKPCPDCYAMINDFGLNPSWSEALIKESVDV